MILLDTHTLFWAAREPEMLSTTARTTLETARRRTVSAVSLYEIASKASKGKWPAAEDLLRMNLMDVFESRGIEILPVTGSVMEMAGNSTGATATRSTG